MPDWLQLFTLARFGRPFLLFVTLYSVLWIVASLARAFRLNVRTNSAATARMLLFITAAAGLAAFIVIVVWYAIDKRYYDFAEPTMSAVAWMLERGKPLYPPPDAPEQYAHIYGPMPFVPLAAAMRLFGTDLSVTKSVGASARVLGPLVLFVILRSRVGLRPAVMFTSHCALLLLVFRNAAFWTRPDSLELLCVSIGVVSGALAVSCRLARPRRKRRCSLELKFSGPLYSLPLLVLFLERGDRRRVVLAIVTAAIVVILPFVLFRNFSVHDYRTWILLSARSRIVWSTLRQNIEWVVYVMAPLGIALRLSVRQQPLTVLSPWVAISLVVAVCSVAVLAAKPGPARTICFRSFP